MERASADNHRTARARRIVWLVQVWQDAASASWHLPQKLLGICRVPLAWTQGPSTHHEGEPLPAHTMKRDVQGAAAGFATTLLYQNTVLCSLGWKGHICGRLRLRLCALRSHAAQAVGADLPLRTIAKITLGNLHTRKCTPVRPVHCEVQHAGCSIQHGVHALQESATRYAPAPSAGHGALQGRGPSMMCWRGGTRGPWSWPCSCCHLPCRPRQPHRPQGQGQKPAPHQPVQQQPSQQGMVTRPISVSRTQHQRWPF